jgi:uncharacterized Zn finger protein
MPEEKTLLDRFTDLSWDDLNHWVGSKIVSSGRNYQQQGRVAELVTTNEGALIAWVNGDERYATKVIMNSDGLPESLCTCLYELDCKHGVATVLEYLEMVGNGQHVPKAKNDDLRIAILEENDWNNRSEDDHGFLSEHLIKDVEIFLKGKTTTQLQELILELSQKYPEIAQDLSDRRTILTGDIDYLVVRLKKEIRKVGEEPGWQSYWQEEGYTPDYSGIRTKFETLLSAGYFDAVLSLGQELIEVGTHQIEQSHDDGETALEIESCMPIVARALERSSLKTADKLVWAVDAVLKDQFDICEVFGDFLYRKHPKAAWNTLADRLLVQLKTMVSAKDIDNFIRNFERDQISNWTIHALERAGRKEEIIPLCESEAKITCSYNRLVKELMTAGRHNEAEVWIAEGITVTKDKLPGIATRLREKLLKIRTLEKDWSAVAAMQVNIFVQNPSCKTFSDCRDATLKIGLWETVSQHLIAYLECGMLPWQQKKWPLNQSNLDLPSDNRSRQFPMLADLIDIAIMEKKPDKVLQWYNQIPEEQIGWYAVDDDAVAASIETYAPEQAVAIWQTKAERLIDQVRPSAYQEAAKYLRKAGVIMAQKKKKDEWEHYLNKLRTKHIRKRRLIEIISGLEGRPIVKNRP